MRVLVNARSRSMSRNEILNEMFILRMLWACYWGVVNHKKRNLAIEYEILEKPTTDVAMMSSVRHSLLRKPQKLRASGSKRRKIQNLSNVFGIQFHALDSSSGCTLVIWSSIVIGQNMD